MAQLLVRNLDDAVKNALRARALENQRSVEEEARVLLSAALTKPVRKTATLGVRMAARFKGIGTATPLAALPRQAVEPIRF
jgi:antitoxin FitA